ncbi:hypothetical protein AGMMS4952_21630 [Spirochaetia bacterium]|nr:hypothetical protein AGMMS4952_21630 [Spirochaetia bacterium]
MSKPIHLSPDDVLCDITRDSIFKAVFTRETPESQGALKFLVSAAIRQPVKVITVIANEPPVNDTRERQIRYDITVKFNDNQLGDVEMTVNPDKEEHKRQEYFLARLFATQEIKGKDRSYRDLRPTYQISLLGKGRIHDDDDLVHRFVYYDPEHNLSFKGLTVIIDIELEKAKKVAAEKTVPEMADIERWAVFFRYHLDPAKRELINEILEYEEGISMAAEGLLTVTQAERDAVRQISELKYELDMQSALVYAKEDGYEQAKKEAEKIIQRLERENEELRRRVAGSGPNTGL